MLKEQIEREFSDKISDQIRLQEEGHDRYRVFTPFRQDDGDHLVILLKKDALNGRWLLTDNGHTYMHLTYDMDESSLYTGTRQQIISKTLNEFSVNDSDGELKLPIENGNFGNALYDFIQALLRVNDVSYLSRERVKSTFMEDFRLFIEEHVPAERRKFEWHHPNFDPAGSYRVDCRINNMPRPLLVFALNNDNKTRDAIITLLKLETWKIEYRSLSVFENQEEISRNVLARFSDVCDKQYSSLITNKDRISRYLDEVISSI